MRPGYRGGVRDPWKRREGSPAAAARIQQQQTWVDQQIRQAVARGDFDDLPGAGKPLELKHQGDPDWWVKQLVERERLAILPPSVQLRKDDAELDDLLDRQPTEQDVRRLLADFNARVMSARLTPVGPPLITQPRDIEREVAAWRRRRSAVRAARAAAASEQEPRRSLVRRLLGRPTHE